MPDPTMHRGFFGDAEHAFALPPERILELERKTGSGIGALSRRMFAGDFAAAEIAETIRIGLVGGGATPEDAFDLVGLYVHGRPLGESYPLATAILEALWWGKKVGATDAAD